MGPKDVMENLAAERANVDRRRAVEYRTAVSVHEAIVAIHKREALIDRSVRDRWPEDANFHAVNGGGIAMNKDFDFAGWHDGVCNVYRALVAPEEIWTGWFDMNGREVGVDIPPRVTKP